MEKNKLVRFFVYVNLLYIPLFAILSIIYLVYNPSKESWVITSSLMIGLTIGVLFNHFIQIPKVYGNKDERQLILQIIAVSFSAGLGFIFVFLIFVLTNMQIIVIPSEFTLLVALLLAFVTLICRFISYKILNLLL